MSDLSIIKIGKSDIILDNQITVIIYQETTVYAAVYPFPLQLQI